MYGLVLMVALTSGTNAVECHRGYYGGWGYHGSYTCYGRYYTGWCRPYYRTCYGWSTPYYYGGVIVSQADLSAPAPATIVVNLPADAKLTINDSPTVSTSGTRTFVSPALERGSTYVYTLRVEVNGQSQSQDIRVRPGEITQAQFAFPASPIAGR